MKALRVYGGGAALASTSFKVGRMGQKAPAETARLTGREPEESMSSSESLSEDVGDSSGVVLGVKFQKKEGAKDFFFSMAERERRGALNRRRFVTGPPLDGRWSRLVVLLGGQHELNGMRGVRVSWGLGGG